MPQPCQTWITARGRVSEELDRFLVGLRYTKASPPRCYIQCANAIADLITPRDEPPAERADLRDRTHLGFPAPPIREVVPELSSGPPKYCSSMDVYVASAFVVCDQCGTVRLGRVEYCVVCRNIRRAKGAPVEDMTGRF